MIQLTASPSSQQFFPSSTPLNNATILRSLITQSSQSLQINRPSWDGKGMYILVVKYACHCDSCFISVTNEDRALCNVLLTTAIANNHLPSEGYMGATWFTFFLDFVLFPLCWSAFCCNGVPNHWCPSDGCTIGIHVSFSCVLLNSPSQWTFTSLYCIAFTDTRNYQLVRLKCGRPCQWAENSSRWCSPTFLIMYHDTKDKETKISLQWYILSPQWSLALLTLTILTFYASHFSAK